MNNFNSTKFIGASKKRFEKRINSDNKGKEGSLLDPECYPESEHELDSDKVGEFLVKELKSLLKEIKQKCESIKMECETYEIEVVLNNILKQEILINYDKFMECPNRSMYERHMMNVINECFAIGKKQALKDLTKTL